MDEIEIGIAAVPREVVSFIALAVLGVLSALLVRSLTRTVIAGLLLVTGLVVANVLGLGGFNLDFLWRTLADVVELLPSVKELMTGLLQTTAKPWLAVGYLIGLLIGLVGFRTLV